jgi:signal transduction histidine kinase
MLLRSTSLIVLGYMISYWGGRELTSQQRLALLKDVSKLSNPRFGPGRTIGLILEQIRASYDADACLLIAPDAHSSKHLLRRADRARTDGAPLSSLASREETQALLALPAGLAVAFRRRPRVFGGARETFYAYDVNRSARVTAGHAESRRLADDFRAASFISAPLRENERDVGRLFIVSPRRHIHQSDSVYIVHLVEQVWQTVRNIDILDRLASEAAARERLKIARDLHDSPIQDYLALKFELEALSRTVAPDNPAFESIRQLAEKANSYVGDLRSFIETLKSGGETCESSLLSAVRQEADHCEELFGIHSEVWADRNILVADRLAAEALQIVREGLSNIRRHTAANRAAVSIARVEEDLVMRITNETDRELSPAGFVPRSITERAKALGGGAEVEQREGLTTVTVRIPL